MQKSRLLVYRQGNYLGLIEGSQADDEQLINLIESYLATQADYRLERQQACGEKRILESSPQGIKVLAKEILYQTIR